ncbi:hypothetical protein DH2020_015862 [Rehmannia glutinosa]|uniref:Ubiquitin-like protease family profile domain-containing protein n=1 Tax=Rehmannia glutinosa TaxID=99300 RepID=A0ABR0WY11_REHGL
MTLLWERQTRYPVSFGKYTRAILDSMFYQSLIFALNDYKKNPTNFKFDNYLINYTNGTWSKFGREWAGCTHLYFPICYNKHWIAAELVFETLEVNIYDPDKGCLTEGQLNQCLEPVTVMLPLLAQQVGIKTNGPLKVVRSDKTSKQGTSIVSSSRSSSSFTFSKVKMKNDKGRLRNVFLINRVYETPAGSINRFMCHSSGRLIDHGCRSMVD